MFADAICAGHQQGDVDLRIDADEAGLVLFEEAGASLESDLTATLDALLIGIAG